MRGERGFRPRTCMIGWPVPEFTASLCSALQEMAAVQRQKIRRGHGQGARP
jgi:hypothetical protein